MSDVPDRSEAALDARPKSRPETSSAARPELRPAIERLVVAISHAVLARTVYPAAHPQTRQAIERACAAFERLLELQHADACALLLVGGELVVDQRPMPRGALFQRGLVDQLERRGIEGLTLTRGLAPEEMERFLDGMVATAGPQSTPHLAIGRVEITAGGTGADLLAGAVALGFGGALGGDAAAGGADDAGTRLATALAVGREALAAGLGEGTAASGPRRPLDLRRFEAAVAPLVAALPQGALVLPDLPKTAGGPIGDALFAHSVRVSLLSVALGRALGLDGSRLQDLGVAALLHDVGKLELPPDLLEKPIHDAADRMILSTHPAVGAARLACSEGDTTLAMLVAYEHHLRFDGGPSYPALLTPRRPLLATQVVSVADTYDAARSARPGTPAATHEAALTILSERSGTWLNPALVAAFTRLVATAPAPQAQS